MDDHVAILHERELITPDARAPRRRRGARTRPGGARVTMLLENTPYPHDIRVRAEARTLASAGYRVRVIAPGIHGQLKREVVEGVQVERFRLNILHSGGAPRMIVEYAIAHVQLYVRGLRALLRGTDVIHVHNPPDLLFPLGFVGRLRGCRFVFDQHDAFPWLVESRFGKPLLGRIARAAQRMSLRAADLVITTNGSQRQDALPHTNCGSDRVIIVRNGLRAESLGGEHEIRRGELKEPNLVYVGLLEQQDGADALIDLVERLVEHHELPGVHLTVVGTGSRLEWMKAETERRGLGDRITFTGLVSHKDSIRMIGGADICVDVAPGTPFNHQSTMVKVIEYVSLGRPTVTFALTETMHIGRDAIAYAPCDDFDAFAALVAKLARSESMRMELSGRARRLAPELMWEHSAKTLLEAYGRLSPVPAASG
jgi:glycosyltransferase involved in cell wall biosynthesis